MEWQLTLVIILGCAIALMFSGMPVAFAFLFVSIIGMFVYFGGETGLRMLITSIRDSVADYILMPVVLFVLMGEVMFHSGIAINSINTLNMWLGRLPGRLSLIAVASGVVLSVLTGVSLASTAILGKFLVPEMEKQGYKKPMTLGPILGSGGLAIMIPPSALAVLVAAVAEVSIGRVLMGIIVPGLLMASLYAAYIIIRCRLQPHLAPAYRVPPVPLAEKLVASVKYILPLGIVVFLVTGVILLGIATPSEAAATGAIGMYALVIAYRKMNWQMVKKSLATSIEISCMLLLIIAMADAWSQVLAISGAARSAIQFTLGLPLAPILMLVAMQLVVAFMGMFMVPVPIMLITIPFFMPVVHALGFNPVWFLIIYMLNIEMATISPPFGLGLFVMKGVAPPDTTMGDVYRASVPYCLLNVTAMALIIVFPPIALWLTEVMLRTST